MVIHHNHLHNVLVETCHRAHLNVKVEMDSNLTSDHDHSRPADILLPNWALGKPAAFDISVTSPLNPKFVSVAGFCQLGQLCCPLKSVNMQKMTTNAMPWAGVVYLWLQSCMVLEEKKP